MESESELELDSAPEGWLTKAFGEVIRPSKAKIEPSECNGVPYLSLEHIESMTGRILGKGTSDDVSSTKAVFRSGDVLYGKLRPYLNKVCVPEFDGVCSTDILVFSKSEELDSVFLKGFLSTDDVVRFANHNSQGVQLPRISFEKLAELPFPLPPIGEQKRISRKLITAEQKLFQARQSLAKVVAVLKRFRQSVLAAACSGRLTADWREAHPDAEPALDVLGNSNRENSDNHSLESWHCTTMGALTNFVTSGSRGWAEYYSESGPFFIRAQDINSDFLRTSDLAHVTPPSGAEGRRTQVQKGDLLITITGANVAKAALVEVALESDAYVSQHVALLRLNEHRFGKFLWIWIVSPEHGRKYLLDCAYGAGKPGLNLTNVREMPTAIPPISEQIEIVSRVDALFKLADTIENRVATATARADKLTQAILKKAFRGELVPTEAELARREGRDYEPAAVLLDRIRKSREEQTRTQKK